MSAVSGSPPSTTVLVVDDDPFILEMARTLLEREGMRVVAVSSGAAALARLAEPAPDLVLLDLGLPDIAGIDVLRHFRAVPAWNVVRILVFTASHEIESLVRAKQAGASGYVCKPVKPETLRSMVEALLTQSSLTWLDDYTRAHRQP